MSAPNHAGTSCWAPTRSARARPPSRRACASTCSHCPTCTAELLELGAAREALLTTVPRASSPPELKSRVMTQVRADAELFAAAREREAGNRETPARAPRRPRGDRRFGWLRAPVPLAAAAACAAVLAVGAGVLGAALVSDDGGSAATRTVSAQVNGTQAPGASARLVVSDDGGSRLRRSGPAVARPRPRLPGVAEQRRRHAPGRHALRRRPVRQRRGRRSGLDGRGRPGARELRAGRRIAAADASSGARSAGLRACRTGRHLAASMEKISAQPTEIPCYSCASNFTCRTGAPRARHLEPPAHPS